MRELLAGISKSDASVYTVRPDDGMIVISPLFRDAQYWRLLHYVNHSRESMFQALLQGNEMYLPDLWPIEEPAPILAPCGGEEDVESPCYYVVHGFDTFASVSEDFFHTDWYADRLIAANPWLEVDENGEIEESRFLVVPKGPIEGRSAEPTNRHCCQKGS